MKKDISVLMSGGMDSLAAALLLRQEGHNVKGVHFRTGFDKLALSRLEETGEQAGIPIDVYDLSRAFREKVIRYFVRAYSMGLTPNPCLVCNSRIKFGVLYGMLRNRGFPFIATGHYARKKKKTGEGFALFRGKDKAKDQSYFLSLVFPGVLEKTVFPLGEYEKSAVRDILAAKGFVFEGQRESQDICFVPDDYARFLKKHGGLSGSKGEITDHEGRVIGEHDGLFRFTVGQRKGISIPAEKPYYVLRLDPENNRLVVGHKDSLYQKRFLVAGINRFSAHFPDEKDMTVQIRYRHRPSPCRVLSCGKKGLLVEFAEPQKAVTPGQAAVFYKNEEVLAAGFIRHPEEMI